MWPLEVSAGTYSGHALDIDRHETKTLLEQGVQIVPIISRVRGYEVKCTNEE
jgi:hypothetical protein